MSSDLDVISQRISSVISLLVQDFLHVKSDELI